MPHGQMRLTSAHFAPGTAGSTNEVLPAKKISKHGTVLTMPSQSTTMYNDVTRLSLSLSLINPIRFVYIEKVSEKEAKTS